jgi:SAM-dependent methyltransferase
MTPRSPHHTEVTVPTTGPLPPLSPNGWLRWDVVQGLLPPAGVDVLEVGCGQGGFGARLAQNYRYVGVEPDSVSSAVAAERVAEAGGRGVVHHGDLSALDADARFDLVCAFEVIEHIEDDAAALRDWVARLRPGGWLLLSTPAFQHRFGPADEMVGHFRRYDPPEMGRILRDAGLEDVDLVQFGAPLGYLLEAGRNAVGRRRAARIADAPMSARTDESGRTLQPSRPLQAAAARLGTLPFRRVQRAFPHHGPGLVARARKPVS